MPKKIFFESAVHQFVSATQELLEELRTSQDARYEAWAKTVATFKFEYRGPKVLNLAWTSPHAGEKLIEYSDAVFYFRGDAEVFVQRQKEQHLVGNSGDAVGDENRAFFKEISQRVLSEANPR